VDAINTLLQYIYFPLALALYALHIKYVKLDTKVSDYLEFKQTIYTTLDKIRIDVHHLIKIREEERS